MSRPCPRPAIAPAPPDTSLPRRVHRAAAARAIEIGGNDYLGKPYQDLELLKAIEQQLETAAARPAE